MKIEEREREGMRRWRVIKMELSVKTKIPVLKSHCMCQLIHEHKQ